MRDHKCKSKRRPDRSSDLRLFVAIYPPVELAQRMVDVLATLELPEHRPTPVEQVHLTLQFIGNVAKRELEATIESVERSASGLGAFQLTPRCVIGLPQRGPTRVIAIETDAPSTLPELQQRLARKARSDSGRSFRPHITIARVRPPRPCAIDDTHRLDLPPFDVNHIAVMRSTLTNAGAVHRELHTVELAG